MMRKKTCLACWLLLGSLVFLSQNIFAQAADKLPAFGMTMSNGRYFTAADIPKGRPVLLIYFAPDCDHCHTLMNAFFQRAPEFEKAEVIMVTFKPVSELTAFEQAYQTFLYSNIKVGTEGNTAYLRMFYKLQNTPFTALYNREGKLVKSYRKSPILNDLLTLLKQL